MANNNPGTFKFVTRPYGDEQKRTPGCEGTCKKCGVTEWYPAVSPGAGHAIFKNKGWLLGRNGAKKDLCPTCANRRPIQVYKPPPPQEAREKAGRITRAGRLASTALDPLHGIDSAVDTHAPVPVNTVLKEKLEAAMQEKATKTPAPTPPSASSDLWPIPKDHWPSRVPNHGVTKGRWITVPTIGFSQRTNAARSAVQWFKNRGVDDAREGEHFVLRMLGRDNWSWGPPGLVKPTRKHARHPVAKPESKPPMPVTPPAPPAPQLVSPPGHVSVTVPTGRPATRQQRQQIRDLLDQHYNTDDERYHGDWSDKKVAEQLDMPRAWVSDLRLDLYGSHDRNEANEQQKRKLAEAIEMAEAATARLIEMASEAEKLANELKEARRRLD